MAAAVFLYDGDCGFCSTCARFIDRFVPGPARVVAWQRTDISALGLTPARCDEAVQWVVPGPSGPVRASGPAAIAALLRTSTPLWRLVGRVLDAPPVRWLAGPVYRFVAAHRDRMPGGTPACALPAAGRPGA